MLEFVKNKFLCTKNGSQCGSPNCADYDESIINCVQDGGFSSIGTICAISIASFEGISFVYIYPPVNGNEVPFNILNTTVHPQPARVFDR